MSRRARGALAVGQRTCGSVVGKSRILIEARERYERPRASDRTPWVSTMQAFIILPFPHPKIPPESLLLAVSPISERETHEYRNSESIHC